MPDFKTILQQSQKLILDSELKQLLLPLWRLIEWQAHAEAIDDGAKLDRSGDAVIHLYPGLEQLSDAPFKVLREFGQFILLRADERGASIWEGKLDVPTPEQITMARDKLTDPEVRKSCHSYQDVLDRYPTQGNSVDRLVFINLANALLANNIVYKDSVGVDILTWGPTAEYANRKRYHSLIPLVSAYAPAEIFQDYGHALAALLENKLQNVRDHSVTYALGGILQRIARIACPAG